MARGAAETSEAVSHHFGDLWLYGLYTKSEDCTLCSINSLKNTISTYNYTIEMWVETVEFMVDLACWF